VSDEFSAQAGAESDPLSLERGFVASLRWLVAEGDARGAGFVEGREGFAQGTQLHGNAPDAARDEHSRRVAELERDLQTALAMLGPGTAVNGNGTLVQRLARLRDRLAEDAADRRQLLLERDAWRAMCTLLTQTRAGMQELLETTEAEHHATLGEVSVLRERVVELTVMHDDAAAQAAATRQELAMLREQLRHWGERVEIALLDLAGSARELAD
jgi:chromosome segregation ATPase